MNEPYDRGDPTYATYQDIDRTNMNKPMALLVCPRCEARDARHDKENISEHPGVFGCGKCGHIFTA